jgi:hypothetical protein
MKIIALKKDLLWYTDSDGIIKLKYYNPLNIRKKTVNKITFTCIYPKTSYISVSLPKGRL